MGFMIETVDADKRPYMPLLLVGDESEEMILRYIDRGVLYIGVLDGEVIAVCVVTEESGQVVEVKNLAVANGFRRMGYGRRMLGHIERIHAGKIIQLGTGEAPSTLSFYKACGFTFSHRIPGFFTDNYPAPIIDDGVELRDMVYLSKKAVWHGR